MALRLPSHFRPTHETAGLRGFPAVDVFAPFGTPVEAGSYGRVDRVSGRRRTGSEPAGGAYGFSVYWINDSTGTRRYATHLDCLVVEVGDRLGPKTRIGRVALPPDSMNPRTAHVHLGSTAP